MNVSNCSACLGSSVGIDLKHLKRLQKDKNSQDLGFNTDATLRLTSNNAKELPGTLELPDVWTRKLEDQDATEGFAIFQIPRCTGWKYVAI